VQPENDPQRTGDLTALIAPDRRVRNALLISSVSMIAGAMFVLLAERVADLYADDTPASERSPRIVEADHVTAARLLPRPRTRFPCDDPGSTF
jgi:hypothetical protein